MHRAPALAPEKDERPGDHGDHGEHGGVSQAIKPPARRILVVDDNGDAAESLKAVLRLQGYEVRTADDGPATRRSA